MTTNRKNDKNNNVKLKSKLQKLGKKIYTPSTPGVNERRKLALEREKKLARKDLKIIEYESDEGDDLSPAYLLYDSKKSNKSMFFGMLISCILINLLLYFAYVNDNDLNFFWTASIFNILFYAVLCLIMGVIVPISFRIKSMFYFSMEEMAINVGERVFKRIQWEEITKIEIFEERYSTGESSYNSYRIHFIYFNEEEEDIYLHRLAGKSLSKLIIHNIKEYAHCNPIQIYESKRIAYGDNFANNQYSKKVLNFMKKKDIKREKLRQKRIEKKEGIRQNRKEYPKLEKFSKRLRS